MHINYNLVVVLSFVGLVTGSAVASASASGCSINYVYPFSPAFNVDFQSSPVLFVKPTHDDSATFVVRFSGLIPEAAASPSLVYVARFEIFSGGPNLIPERFFSHPFSPVGSTFELTIHFTVPVEALPSDTYITASASVHATVSDSTSSHDSSLCQRDVRFYFEGSDARSSVSDNGAYPLFCEEAANDAHIFANFKSHHDYTKIVTSLDHREALGLIPIIRREAREDEIRHVIELVDTIGGPTLHELDGLNANPSTLRYISTALSLFARFGSTKNMSIVELGGGFGGQSIALAAMKMGGFSNYVDIDLAESCMLAKMHIGLTRALSITSKIESDILGHFLCIASEMWSPATVCDLFISNYALSELSAALQMQIIQGIVAFCKRGHIQANDISSHHGLEGSSTAKLVKALQDTGLELFVRPMFMEQGSLPVPVSGVTIIEWGCSMPGCSDRVE